MAVTQAAMKSDRTISEELVARVQQSFHWERTFRDVNKLMDDARQMMGKALQTYMISEGWTPISTSNGVLWAPPESAVSETVKKALNEIKVQP